MKTEEIIEENEKSKIKFSKVFLGALFVIFTLVGVFFLATYIRWKAEISNKTQIIYTGQEEVKIDKLVDFYDVELSADLKEYEAINMYCTSEYGKDCIMPDYNNFLENNFRKPLVAISIIVLIDIIIVYVLIHESLVNKKKTYVIGGVIILWGLINMCVTVYNVADYYKLENKGNEIIGKQLYYLRTNNKKGYTPYITYSIPDPKNNNEILEIKFFPEDFQMNGTFESKDITLYQDKNKTSLVSPKRSYKKYIVPFLTSLLTMIMGFIFLTINQRNKKRELKEKNDKK